eukprot:3148148-Amphidinium_carterae.1
MHMQAPLPFPGPSKHPRWHCRSWKLTSLAPVLRSLRLHIYPGRSLPYSSDLLLHASACGEERRRGMQFPPLLLHKIAWGPPSSLGVSAGAEFSLALSFHWAPVGSV